jgi:hypothetical protein
LLRTVLAVLRLGLSLAAAGWRRRPPTSRRHLWSATASTAARVNEKMFGPLDLSPLATFGLVLALGLPAILALC